MKTFISWNVNGIRSCEGKGLFEFLKTESPDILCLQETKAQEEQLSEKFTKPAGYRSWFAQAVKKGYSGVAVYQKESLDMPLSVSGLGIPEYDDEGRVLVLEYPDYSLICAYFPNSQPERKRIDYKLGFCDAILKKCNSIVKNGGNIIMCGDYNIAHKPIDLANPKQNEQNPGYLPEERAWMDQFIADGYSDVFRHFNQEPGQYTWWSYRSNARARNVGWRIDYFCTNQSFLPRVKKADIMPEITGSDHCPVRLVIK